MMPADRSAGDAGRSQQLRNVRRRVRDGDPRRLKGRALRLRGSRPSRDDRPRVAHTSAWRRGAAGDERSHRLAHLSLHEGGSLLLLLPADLADHHDPLGLRVLVEHVQHVDEAGADDRIAPDAHAGRLPDPRIGHGLHHLVGEGARAADEPNRARPVDVIGDDSHLRPLAHAGEARAVGAQQPDALLAQYVVDAEHVERRDILGDAYDQWHPAALAADTALAAASSSESAVISLASARIGFASSALVPTMRTTMGTSRVSVLRASTMPRATSSPRVMPPKMLMRMALTLGSLRMIRNAAATLSALAPPPMSRKLAGSPPASLTRSMVVMASPAPLTMQPMLPSSLMKLMPASRAAVSDGSSSLRSRMRSMSACRASPESSSTILASSAVSRPSSVIARGLIAARSPSVPTNASHCPRCTLRNSLRSSAAFYR